MKKSATTKVTAIDEELRGEFIDYLNDGSSGIHDAPLYFKDSSRPGYIRWTSWGEEKFTSEKDFLPRYRQFLEQRCLWEEDEEDED